MYRFAPRFEYRFVLFLSTTDRGQKKGLAENELCDIICKKEAAMLGANGDGDSKVSGWMDCVVMVNEWR